MLSDPPTTETGRKRQRYNRLIWGAYGTGIVAILVGSVADLLLPGTVLYLAGVVVGTALSAWAHFVSPVTLQDERHRHLCSRASYWTLLLAGYAGLAVFPPLFVLEAAGYYEFQPIVEGVLYSFSALFVTFGGFCLYFRYRP